MDQKVNLLLKLHYVEREKVCEFVLISFKSMLAKNRFLNCSGVANKIE